MAGERSLRRLGEICEFRGGQGFPQKHQGAAAGEYPFVKVSDMELPGNGYRITRANHWIDEATRKELRAKPHPATSTIFAKIGVALTYNRRRLLSRPTIVDNNMMAAVPIESEVEPLFLYYLLKVTDFNEVVSGTALPFLNAGDLAKMEVEVPPLAEQKAIAGVLGALDDKIELNRRMNATLEAMARALFQSWFVDFDPVRAKLDGHPPAALFPTSFQDSPIGHIPTGWEAAELGQIADVIDCLHAKKPERCEAGQLYLQLNNIRDDGLIDITDSFFVSVEDYKKWISRMEAVAGDCVITNVGRVGAVGQIPEGVKAALGRNITGIRCKAEFPFPTFLIECLVSESMREEIRLKTDSGTILDALNVKSIPKLRFARPSREIATRFENLTRPLRRQMEQNITESRTLATLRDTLLPKLLSGELSVPELETIA
jgi:type I restriction enzyme S subunit